MINQVFMEYKTALKYCGFPKSHLKLIRCPEDQAEFVFNNITREITNHVINGSLRCQHCNKIIPIVNGIVMMLEKEMLDLESLHELNLRDQENNSISEQGNTCLKTDFRLRLEMQTSLAYLNLFKECILLELGCGRGRYTNIFASKCNDVMAVDFSLGSLELLRRKLSSNSRVSLINANILKLALAPNKFNRVFSTTSLDTREQRMVMHHLAADALSGDGRYVFSTENYDLRSRLLGLPRATRYTPGGIYFCKLERREVKREMMPYFSRILVRPIQIVLPLIHIKSQQKAILASRIAERVPFVSDLGELLMVCAKKPLHAPKEGTTSGGNIIFKILYRMHYKT